jgi:hypothetical protein
MMALYTQDLGFELMGFVASMRRAFVLGRAGL